MTQPIGRLFFNANCVSGYIVIGPNQGDVVKFACQRADNGVVLIYPSKKGLTMTTEEAIEKSIVA